jgi:membrane glycosyltransferase
MPPKVSFFPEATGLFAVRFIWASVSFSTAMLMAFALPVTKKPPINNNTIISQSYCTTFGASK